MGNSQGLYRPSSNKQSWPQESEQQHKWTRALNFGMVMPRMKGAYDEQKTPLEALTSL